MVHFTGNSAQTNAKITSTGARSNSTHMPTTYITQMPKFLSINSTISRFWVMSQFWMIKSICGIYTSEAQFSSVSLYDEPFWSHAPFFQKVHWMTPKDLDMLKVKNTNMPSTYAARLPLPPPPPRPKFSSVLLHNEQFLSYKPIFSKVYRMTPNDFDMF